MPVAPVRGTKLHYETHGSGDPLVLVHGSLADRHSWDAVVALLASNFQVITFDRRGHSTEENGSAQGTIDDDVADLEGLIQELGAAPAHVAGISMGASICLKLAARSPESLRSVNAHEPPLLALLRGERGSRAVGEDVEKRIAAAVEVLAAGDTEAGLKTFIDTIAIGPGTWDMLPAEVLDTFRRNAPTFVEENRDADWPFSVDVGALSKFDKPVLLSEGDQSPSFFSPIVSVLRCELPGARHHVFHGQGHVPNFTDPSGYAEVVKGFLAENPG